MEDRCRAVSAPAALDLLGGNGLNTKKQRRAQDQRQQKQQDILTDLARVLADPQRRECCFIFDPEPHRHRPF